MVAHVVIKQWFSRYYSGAGDITFENMNIHHHTSSSEQTLERRGRFQVTYQNKILRHTIGDHRPGTGVYQNKHDIVKFFILITCLLTLLL